MYQENPQQVGLIKAGHWQAIGRFFGNIMSTNLDRRGPGEGGLPLYRPFEIHIFDKGFSIYELSDEMPGCLPVASQSDVHLHPTS